MTTSPKVKIQDHCFHPKKTSFHDYKCGLVPPDYVVEECCSCGTTQMVKFDPRLDHGEYHD